MNQEGSNTDNGNPSQVAPKDKGSESNHSDTNEAYQLLKMSAQQQENLPTASEKTTTQEERKRSRHNRPDFMGPGPRIQITVANSKISMYIF
jgi:hypothetical protein